MPEIPDPDAPTIVVLDEVAEVFATAPQWNPKLSQAVAELLMLGRGGTSGTGKDRPDDPFRPTWHPDIWQHPDITGLPTDVHEHLSRESLAYRPTQED